jgi:23S rRNA (cytidine1920-2'-O)/16S rRNA (cytidine1409-2'-O)-methyltransferase
MSAGPLSSPRRFEASRLAPTVPHGRGHANHANHAYHESELQVAAGGMRAPYMDEDTKVRSGRGTRERLDVLLVERGLAPSRERARALIMAGRVLVNKQPVAKAGTMVAREAECTLAARADELRYVSRGGLKLERALDVFQLDPSGRICLDVGASTGGFTDVLLKRNASRVYAVDVGHGQLAWELQTDSRVVVLDRTNIRYLKSLPESPISAVIDVSFISLRLVLPPVAALLAPGGWIVALVKPQFEAGRREVSRGGGVISDPAVHQRVLQDLLEFVAMPGRGLETRGLIASPITGRDGNHEYLLWLSTKTNGEDTSSGVHQPELPPIDAVISAAFGHTA